MLYFDNAATTYPKPDSVIRSVNTAITRYGGNPGRGGHDMAMRVSEKIFEVRKKAGAFFNAEAENVIFTLNCTMSLNTAIKGVLQEGEHIICSCLEHNSVIRPIYKLCQDNKITYDIATVYENNDERTLRSFANCIRRETKAIVCTHASNVSGMILPIRKIGELCQKKNILFIVDAAQSAGVLPIDMKKDHINILCMPGHKGLYGITGSGMMILNGEGLLNTLVEGGTGSLSIARDQPDFYPDRMESGTVNTAGIFSIGAGLDFIKLTGMERIYQHEFRLCRILYDSLQKMPRIRLYNSEYLPYRNAPIVSFNIEGIESDELTELLNQKGFALRGGLHCAPLAHEYYGTLDIGMVRFAPSAFTHESDVYQLIKNIKMICEN